MELSALKILATKANFNRFYRFIEPHTVTKDTFVVLQDMEVWYKDHEDIDWLEFDEWFRLTRHIKLSKTQLDLFSRTFEKLSTLETSDTEEEIIKTLITRDYIKQIVDKGLDGVDKPAPAILEDIESILSSYRVEAGKVEKIESKFVTTEWDEILEHVTAGNGLNWRLKELNLSCGPIRKGDFLIIAARPDAGKTTMLASEVSFMAAQLEEGKHVLWFNNEEAGAKVQYRIMQAALGKTTDWITENKGLIREQYIKAVGSNDKIKVLDNKRLHVKDVEEILRNYNVGLIIFDQLWKVFGFERESVSEVDRQTKLFAWAREIAGYCPVITVHQADGSAEGQEYIEMNQLYGSKTGVQGEADAIITLGRSNLDIKKNVRGLYVPKNKLAGGPDSAEEYRKAKFEITIQPEIARFKGEF